MRPAAADAALGRQMMSEGSLADRMRQSADGTSRAFPPRGGTALRVTFALGLALSSAMALAPPMAHAQRLENSKAVFAALDKVTARISKLEIKLGETVKFGALKVTPRACYSRPPTEPPKTSTFVEIDDSGHRQLVEVRPARWGDAVIVRKDTPTSYHLAVVVDDAAQGITHVTRGLDLFAATDLHRLLQDLLALPAPLYHHHRLIAGSDGRKLSKSARDTSLRALREDGAVPADIRAMLRSITGAAI